MKNHENKIKQAGVASTESNEMEEMITLPRESVSSKGPRRGWREDVGWQPLVDWEESPMMSELNKLPNAKEAMKRATLTPSSTPVKTNNASIDPFPPLMALIDQCMTFPGQQNQVFAHLKTLNECHGLNRLCELDKRRLLYYLAQGKTIQSHIDDTVPFESGIGFSDKYMKLLWFVRNVSWDEMKWQMKDFVLFLRIYCMAAVCLNARQKRALNQAQMKQERHQVLQSAVALFSKYQSTITSQVWTVESLPDAMITSMAVVYLALEDYASLRRLFEMSQQRTDQISLPIVLVNCLLSLTMKRANGWQESLILLQELKDTPLNMVTINTLLSSAPDFPSAWHLYSTALAQGLSPTQRTFRHLICISWREGKPVTAIQLLQQMQQRWQLTLTFSSLAEIMQVMITHGWAYVAVDVMLQSTLMMQRRLDGVLLNLYLKALIELTSSRYEPLWHQMQQDEALPDEWIHPQLIRNGLVQSFQAKSHYRFPFHVCLKWIQENAIIVNKETWRLIQQFYPNQYETKNLVLFYQAIQQRHIQSDASLQLAWLDALLEGQFWSKILDEKDLFHSRSKYLFQSILDLYLKSKSNLSPQLKMIVEKLLENCAWPHLLVPFMRHALKRGDVDLLDSALKRIAIVKKECVQGMETDQRLYDRLMHKDRGAQRQQCLPLTEHERIQLISVCYRCILLPQINHTSILPVVMKHAASWWTDKDIRVLVDYSLKDKICFHWWLKWLGLNRAVNKILSVSAWHQWLIWMTESACADHLSLVYALFSCSDQYEMPLDLLHLLVIDRLERGLIGDAIVILHRNDACLLPETAQLLSHYAWCMARVTKERHWSRLALYWRSLDRTDLSPFEKQLISLCIS